MFQIAETARKLGIMVIADEVYGHLAFGINPCVSMGVFGSIVPVLTLGSISKRWAVPGWRLGWIVAHDTHGVLEETQVLHIPFFLLTSRSINRLKCFPYLFEGRELYTSLVYQKIQVMQILIYMF